MKIPRGSNNFVDRCAKKLASIYSSSTFVKLFLVPMLLTFPAVVAAIYSSPQFKELMQIHFPHYLGTTGEFVASYNWLLLIMIGVYPIILQRIGKEIHDRAHSNGLNVDGLLALITSLDQIVGTKYVRFAAHASNMGNLTCDNAFRTITEPDKQIAEIVKEVCSFFNATRTEKSKSLIRVTLAVIQDGRIANLPVYYPSDEPIKSTITSLNSPESAFLTAVKTKKMVLIPDIKKELSKSKDKRKFAETENEEDNSGSIICYPIRNGNMGIPYVISVHCEQSGYFKNEFKDLYEHSLQRFALRLNVEHNLYVMKERLCGQ